MLKPMTSHDLTENWRKLEAQTTTGKTVTLLKCDKCEAVFIGGVGAGQHEIDCRKVGYARYIIRR